MSRIGKQPITVPDGVTVEIKDRTVTAKGPLGEESWTLLDGIDVDFKENVITIIAKDAEKNKKIAAFSGLSRSLINNLVLGVSRGFEKVLEIVGVGYRAVQQDKDVQLQVGYSHPVLFPAPEGITLEVADGNKITIKGSNKQQVGQVAADIRKIRPPEPYKGKGIRYQNEYVRKKAGKSG
jgi:large subunit ribosomal protein L6